MAAPKKEAIQKHKKALDDFLAKVTEDYTMNAVVGHALAHALILDYADVVAKLEGIPSQQVVDRVCATMHDTLNEQGWHLYNKHRGTKNKPHPALGMIFGEWMMKTCPQPVLKMPYEVESEPKAAKKTRKRYI